MRALVDTSVWSLALRRTPKSGKNDPVVDQLTNLIASNRVEIIGPVRQELLSGVRDEGQFEVLAKRLAAFPDLPIISEDYVTAARLYNSCRSKGIQGSNTDFLICATAIRYQLAIFTTDSDFSLFSRHIPIALHVF